MASSSTLSITSSYKRVIQLYSGNRNRCLYPLPASFTVPFSAVLNNQNNPINALDPVCDGAVEFEFTLYSNVYPFITGVYREKYTGNSWIYI